MSQEAAAPLADGRYRLMEVLGAGGMATVYRAWDERLRTQRAIKVLDARFGANDVIKARFITEAQTMARLHHANIVGVHDIGSDADRSFIVMELIEGGSLNDYIARHGPMHPRLACGALADVLAALEVAHDAGVIHRDIKPQNVLVTPQGQPKVTDFGIARVEGEDGRSLTRTGSVMGTWGFMAPEQRMSARRVDGRADVYSVGATLFTLLTNELPVDLFASEMDDELLRAVPDQLREVVRKATSYRPDDRYADVAEMRRALEAMRDALPPPGAEVPPLGGGAPVGSPRGSALEKMTPATPAGTGGETFQGGLLESVVLGDARANPTLAPAPEGGSPTLLPESGTGSTRVEPEVAAPVVDLTRPRPPEPGPPAEPAARLAPPPSTGTLSGGELTEEELAAVGAGRRTGRGVLVALGVVLALALVVVRPWESPAPVQPPVAPQEPTLTVDPATEAPPVEPEVVEPPTEVESAPPVGSRPDPKTGAASGVRTGGSAEPDPPPADPPDEDPGPETTPDGGSSGTPWGQQGNEVRAPDPGRFGFEGDVLSVVLEGATGRYGPGELPAGDYAVMATFADGNPVVAGRVKVAPGQQLTLNCVSAFSICKPK